MIVPLATGIAAATGHSQNTQQGLVQIGVDRVTIRDVASDRVRLDVVSHVTSSRKLKVRRVSFGGMRLGTLPIYLSPIDDPLTLGKNIPATLPPIPVTIYFRDLDSLQPLEEAVRDEQATVDGIARVDLDLNLLERLAGGVGMARGEVPVKVTVPVTIPGGIAGQTVALATLGAAQLALDLGGSELHLLHEREKSWEAQVRSRYMPAVVIAEAKYALVLKNGQREEFRVQGLGFRISPDRFVLTGEMMEPWKYDSETAAALESGAATLAEDGSDLLVWPIGEALNDSTGRSLAQGAIQVEHAPGRTESAMFVAGTREVKIRLLPRDSYSNYAVLRFTRPEDQGPAIPAATEEAGQPQNWDRLILFRADDQGQLEFIATPAHRQDGRILLEDSVDDRAFGSLLLSPQGAVGMVQDENCGMAMRTSW